LPASTTKNVFKSNNNVPIMSTTPTLNLI
jgi:hypothetical protein